MSDYLKMHSPNLVDENIDKLAELFPNCITEAQNEQGELIKVVDFDLLRQELSRSLVEGGQERYRLDWPGKKEAILTANAPIAKTLRPNREESVNFDTTENLFIEGDNLDALKLLQENYLGKVKMIYIDPPYNTGNDFIYEDDFAESTDKFFEKSNQVDEEGHRLIANTESNGRFHSDWLSMMYSRLKLARNLLKDDGVVFISIDDNEQANLKKICDEIFGSTNFVAQFIHKNNSIKNQAKTVSVSTEYFFCYAKTRSEIFKLNWKLPKKGVRDIVNLFTRLRAEGLSIADIDKEIKEMYSRPKYSHLSRWNKVDELGVFKDADLSREGGPKHYTIINPTTGKPCVIPSRGWGKSEAELKRLQSENLIWYGDNDTPPGLKDYIDGDDLTVPDNFFYFDNSTDTRWIKEIFNGLVFQNPKPIEMIKILTSMVTKDMESLILDFFAGSSTTAHAVMQLNAEDGGNRKFIMVQLPEITDEKSEANKAGYSTIAEISKERIRRAGQKIISDNADKEGIENLDVGFRVLKVDFSNMKDVYYTPDALQQSDLVDLASNIKEDRTSEDLLFQVMLDWGLELSLPIERKIVAGNEVFYVAGNSLVACFDELSVDVIDEVSKVSPLRFVSAEIAIQQDHDKTNIKERFKQLSPDTEVKFI